MARGYPQFGGYSNYLSLAQGSDQDAMSLLDYAKLSMDMDRNRRQEENQEFNQQARTIQMMLKNYHDTKSPTLKQHISDSMRAYWPKVNPKFHEVLAPILAGSPLDEAVEKEEYWDKNAKPRPRKPVKQPDQEPEVYNQELAEFHYADYLYGRLRDKYFGIPIGPLKESLVLGEDTEGNMRYVVKYKDTPARMVTSKGLEMAKIIKDRNMSPSEATRFLGNPILRSSQKLVAHGDGQHIVTTEEDILTGETSIRVDKIPVLPKAHEPVPEKRKIKEPSDLAEFRDAVEYGFNPAKVEVDKSGEKPGYLAYATLGRELEELFKAKASWWLPVSKEDKPEKLKGFITRRLEEMWPGWTFRLDWDKYPTRGKPFGTGTKINAAPGEYRGMITKNEKKQDVVTDFTYESINNVIYKLSTGRALGTLEYVQGNLNNVFLTYDEVLKRLGNVK